MNTAKIYSELQEIKKRLLIIEKHLPQDDKIAERYKSEICTLFGIIRKKAPVIPLKVIIAEAKKNNINQKTTSHCLNIMEKNGDIYEPKKGYIQRI